MAVVPFASSSKSFFLLFVVACFVLFFVVVFVFYGVNVTKG